MHARIPVLTALLVAAFLALAPAAAVFAEAPVHLGHRSARSLIGQPAAPQNLIVTPVTSSDTTVSWTAPVADGGTLSGYGYTVVDHDTLAVVADGTTDGATTSVDVGGLVVGDSYDVTVTATYSDLTSAATTTSYVAIAPPIAAPAAPANVLASISDNGDGTAVIDASWDSPAGAASYALELDGSDGSTATSRVSTLTATFSVAADRSVSYTVRVTAENALGDSGTTSSRPVSLPCGYASVPVGVTVNRDADSNGFTVSWQRSGDDGGSPISGYVVAVTDDTSGGIAAGRTTTDPATSSADFTDLVIGHQYDIQVWAVTGKGDGAKASVSFSLDAVRPGAPRNLRLIVRGSGSLEGTWDAPAYDGGSGVTRYETVVTDGHGQRYLSAGDPSSTDAVFSVPVTAGETYTLSVAATNAAGTGDPTTGGPVTGPVATAPQAPSLDAKAVGYHDAALGLSWRPPADGGAAITGYSVTLYDAAGNALRTESVPGNAGSYLLTGLENDTSYGVTIQAHNVVGDSAPSDVQPVTTLPLVPPAPLPQTIDDGDIPGVELAMTGSTMLAHIDNATPGSWVYGVVYSTPAVLGWQQVDAAGDASWTLPSLDPGIHHFAVLDGDGAIIGTASFVVPEPAADDPGTPAVPLVTTNSRAAASVPATGTAVSTAAAPATTNSTAGDAGLLGGAGALVIIGAVIAGSRLLHRDGKH